MNIHFRPYSFTLVTAILLSAATANAQRGGLGRRDSFDPADILKRADDNNNGIIEPGEVSNRNRMFIERAAERAKLDMTKAMPLDKLLPAMQANFDDFRKQQESGSRPGGPPSSSTLTKSSTPPQPSTGFGAPAGGAPAATTSSGFGSPSGRATSIISLEAKFDQSVIDYVNGTLLREQDKNGDGYIDKSEWVNGNWSKSNPPENSDLNKDSKLSREELCIRISKSRGIPIKGETASSTPSTSSSSSGPPSGSSGSSGSSSSSPDYKKYAEGLLKQFDKSKDGMLQRDEWKEMKTEHQGADSNGDGTITLEELTTRISAYSSGGASSSPLSSGSSGYGGGKSFRGGADKTASTAKKSYRFLTPTERLPKGMPDWFIKNDADGDGQIMMAEYSTSWTESTAAEFAKFDLNGDGIITPNECLAIEKK